MTSDRKCPSAYSAVRRLMGSLRHSRAGGHYSPALTLAMLIRRRVAVHAALLFARPVERRTVGGGDRTRDRRFRQPAVTAATTLEGSTLVAAIAIELVFTCVRYALRHLRFRRALATRSMTATVGQSPSV